MTFAVIYRQPLLSKRVWKEKLKFQKLKFKTRVFMQQVGVKSVKNGKNNTPR